jgi:hypothetical protein
MIDVGYRERWAHWGHDGWERTLGPHAARWVDFAALTLWRAT